MLNRISNLFQHILVLTVFLLCLDFHICVVFHLVRAEFEMWQVDKFHVIINVLKSVILMPQNNELNDYDQVVLNDWAVAPSSQALTHRN